MGNNNNKNKDGFDVALEFAKELFVTIMTTIIDCLEQSFNCMTVVGGKNLMYTIIITLSFIPVTGLFSWLGIQTMLCWQDALVASFIILMISGINGASKMMVDKSIIKAKEVYQSYRERGNSNEQQ